jgi:hypothetical protein
MSRVSKSFLVSIFILAERVDVNEPPIAVSLQASCPVILVIDKCCEVNLLAKPIIFIAPVLIVILKLDVA